MFNPTLSAELARAHQDDLLRDAATRRTVRTPRRGTVRWPRRPRTHG